MAPLLRVSGLSKRFGEIVVADAVSFELARGECLGVIGPNGAGKSSLLNLVVGLLTADGGSIMLDDKEITGLPPHQRARMGLGRAFQIPQLFLDQTVLDNLMIAVAARRGIWVPFRALGADLMEYAF